MVERKFLYDVLVDDLTKYEIVLLTARRGREINEMRIALEKKHETRLIEKEKPTIVAMREILRGDLGYTFRRSGEKPMKEQFKRGMKKTL